MVSAHSGVEITQEVKMFVAGDVLDDVIQAGVEFVFASGVVVKVGA